MKDCEKANLLFYYRPNNPKTVLPNILSPSLKTQITEYSRARVASGEEDPTRNLDLLMEHGQYVLEETIEVTPDLNFQDESSYVGEIMEEFDWKAKCNRYFDKFDITTAHGILTRRDDEVATNEWIAHRENTVHPDGLERTENRTTVLDEFRLDPDAELSADDFRELNKIMIRKGAEAESESERQRGKSSCRI